MPTPQINEETILKRYESLPDDLKEALMGVATADAIYEIGRRSNLNVEKIGALAEEVGLIILGFTPSANFISDLKTALGVNEEKATEIASEINERIFLSIRESLKRLHGASWGEGLVKPPTKFEGQKVAEVKPAPPLPEIKPEAKVPPSLPKEPMIIRPMGTAGAAPKEEIRGVTEIPRPAPPPPPVAPRPALPPTPPVATTRPVSPPTPPQIPAVEKKPLEIRPPGGLAAEEKKLPISTTPKPALPSAPQIKPPVVEIKPPEIKLPLAPPLEIKAEVKPTPEIKPVIKLPPPTLPTAERKPAAPLTPPAPPSPPPMPSPPKPVTPPSPSKPAETGAGYDPYKEPIE